MTPHLSHPCRCAAVRIPYGNNVVLGDEGVTHRLGHCDGYADVEPPPTGWRLLNATCEHSEALWVTGPDPAELLEALGCPCEETPIARARELRDLSECCTETTAGPTDGEADGPAAPTTRSLLRGLLSGVPEWVRRRVEVGGAGVAL